MIPIKNICKNKYNFLIPLYRTYFNVNQNFSIHIITVSVPNNTFGKHLY